MRPFILNLLAVTTCCSPFNTLTLAAESKLPTTNQLAQAIAIPGVHNAFRATEKIYSGSQPEGDAAFAALARLGIKTIVSVDGAAPDVTAARKHGLRYIHLPFGYAGVPTNRVIELAKVATAEAAPIYVHCHHGQHRGPAAVAVMCEATAGWTPHTATAWLHEAGTAADYAGLYRTVREFQMPTPTELAAVRALPEIARSTSIVEAMVALDGRVEHLRQTQRGGWKTPAEHADISPTHEATLLWEQVREITRLPETPKRSADFHRKLETAEQAAATLRALLNEPVEVKLIDAAFKKLHQTCADCHKQYRNQ